MSAADEGASHQIIPERFDAVRHLSTTLAAHDRALLNANDSAPAEANGDVDAAVGLRTPVDQGAKRHHASKQPDTSPLPGGATTKSGSSTPLLAVLETDGCADTAGLVCGVCCVRRRLTGFCCSNCMMRV
jgi:hypothetical protein